MYEQFASYFRYNYEESWVKLLNLSRLVTSNNNSSHPNCIYPGDNPTKKFSVKSTKIN